MIRAGWQSLALPVVSLILGMLLILLIQSEVLRAIAALRNGAHRITQGQLDTRVVNKRSDELGQLTLSFNQMAAQLQTVHQEMQALESMQSMLASSQTVAEAYDAAMRVCKRLLPRINGAFYAIAASRNLTEMVNHWGDAAHLNSLFAPKECRALRTGRMHAATENSVEVFCQHMAAGTRASVCIPLTSGDESLGLMLLAVSPDSAITDITEQEKQLALTIADMLSLALNNIRLSEKLHAQSIRDPLTGLYNRRYLEETMKRELARSVRQAKPLSVVALDADYFKKFNDQFGHDAGDKVLKEIAEQMRQVVRPSDLACRLGGEEFLLVMPDADTEIAIERAEQLRTRIAAVVLHYQGRSLGHITVSLGVATAPIHAKSAAELLQKADAALYLAKHNGRNKVEIATVLAASS
ncbi:diguanylate cyclase [Arsukibacterium sp.]|uniref:diguanylate cyclase n=1 Tax=Arsukibacterium sp. TaxID=1977258 RepID=UPI00299EC89B|nr:diguanylate cyclase [Arsukibacterium sp.]MDX1678881.1 diguanylate cyclase [Arsukibacterium sp.]